MESPPALLRRSYQSEVTGAERDYFVYLPPHFESRETWPVLLFLHGNGERGNAKDELDFVLKHGPLFEAWCQRRDLPFVIVSPQLPMFSMGEVSYIKSRRRDTIPRRHESGELNPGPAPYGGDLTMHPAPAVTEVPYPVEGLPEGWPLLETEVMALLEDTVSEFRGDRSRIYLSGISYGGFGTWWIGAHHPEVFAAIAPVVGYAHPDLAVPLAQAGTPIWVFAGGRDTAVPPEYFYPVVRALEEAGHQEVRFTIHADLGHEAWTRIYAGQDLYDWLLAQELSSLPPSSDMVTAGGSEE